MVRFFIGFIILLGSVYLGIQLSYDPGYLLIAINHWTLETTVWFAIFGILFSFIALHLFLNGCYKIMAIPAIFAQWNSRRRTQKAHAITRQGLIEYSEGYWKKAQNHLIQALPNTDTPLLNYLAAARAAQKMGDSQLRDHYLREAQQSMPEAKIAVELTQAQLQLANHQWEQALATLRHLHDLAPRHPYVLKLLMNLYEEVKDWTLLIELLPTLKKQHILSPQMFESLQHKAYLQSMRTLEKQNHVDAMEQLFKSLPKSLTTDAKIIGEYVIFLINNKKYVEAEIILKRCLRKNFDNQLIELYGLLPEIKNQLQFAESLLKKQPDSAYLFLCLGRLCATQHLWGKAKQYFEKSLDLELTPNAYMELGKLHETLNSPDLACYNYKKGLALIANNELILTGIELE